MGSEDAIQRLNGFVIGKQTVRLSWGRNPASKQVIALPSRYLKKVPLVS